MLVVVVLVPAVIRSGGWLVFVSTSWAAAACPRVLGIVFVDSDQNEAPLLLFSGRGRGATSPSYYGRDVDGQGGSTLFSVSMFFSRSSGVVLLSCHLSFFTDWPYLWQRSVPPLLPHRRRNTLVSWPDLNNIFDKVFFFIRNTWMYGTSTGRSYSNKNNTEAICEWRLYCGKYVMNRTDLELVCYCKFCNQYIASMNYPYKTFRQFFLAQYSTQISYCFC